MRHTILPAKPADAADILALQRLAYESEARLYGDRTIPPLTQTLEELRAEFERLVILKAAADPAGDGPLLGSVRAGLDGVVCRVGRLIVRPEVQGRGLGTALLAAVEERFPTAVRFSLFTGARSAGNLRLYQRLGYRPVREEAVSPALILVFLEKPGPAAR
ncbi:GNAT family N-acetyltransferase [Desulfovibrio aminophilus]|nr:GNAT family N-acetyltransferase [Desulfovibrio aminophilus]MCM0754752.1 GNAT family N-acetyltransferase [Desulfovibrio aminophilus]